MIPNLIEDLQTGLTFERSYDFFKKNSFFINNYTIFHVIIIIVIGLLTRDAVANSQDIHTYNADSLSQKKCLEASNTTDELENCAKKYAELSDKKLNEVYQDIICILDNDEKKSLQTAQRAWVVFRDKDCSFWGGGGSISTMNMLMCRAQRSTTRANELMKWPPNTPRESLRKCK